MEKGNEICDEIQYINYENNEDKQGNHQHWAEKKKDERREVARCDEGQMAKDTGGDDVAC